MNIGRWNGSRAAWSGVSARDCHFAPPPIRKWENLEEVAPKKMIEVLSTIISELASGQAHLSKCGMTEHFPSSVFQRGYEILADAEFVSKAFGRICIQVKP